MSDLAKIFKDTRQHLMSGVSYMIPFVVAGGILLALSVAVTGKAGVPETYFLKNLFNIGVAGFTLMIPILAGFIAFSIADRPGIAPAAIGGYIANQVGAGFLGAIIAGLIGGIVVYYLKKIPVPAVMRSVMPIFVIPIIATFITAGLMQFVIGAPIAGIMEGLTNWLKGLQSGSKVVLGLIIGLMMAFDMGGPINKVAYSFGILTISEGIYTIAGPMAVAICVPPIGMGLATFLAPKKYKAEEREAGKAAILMGSIGITEGAIPFAAGDPLKVIPSIMIGGAVGTALAMVSGVENMAAWGGLIVLPVVKNRLMFIVSIIVGSVVTALVVNALKKPVNEAEVTGADDDDVELDFSL